MVSKLRARFRTDAEKELKACLSDPLGHHKWVTRAIKKVKNRGATREYRPRLMQYKEPVPPDRRHSCRKGKPLTVHEKLDIAHKVLVENELRKDVAKEYRISYQVVNRIVDKVKKKPGWLTEIISQHEEKATRRALLADGIDELNKQNRFLDSA